MTDDTIYVSLGNYCLTSFLLKENGMKAQSHPFDWMITTIENIIHNLENNFQEFLNIDNYEIINGLTRNRYYFNNTIQLFVNETRKNVDHQHHNLTNSNDYNYLVRCVDRFRSLGDHEKIVFVMIQPLYLNGSNINENQILLLYKRLCEYFDNDQNIKLVVFNVLKMENHDFKKSVFENGKLIVVELDTKMVLGKKGMMWFDKNGIKKFLDIVKNVS